MTYTIEFLLDEIKRFIYENGVKPEREDMCKENSYPDVSIYDYYFGSFEKATKYRKPKRVCTESVIVDNTEIFEDRNTENKNDSLENFSNKSVTSKNVSGYYAPKHIPPLYKQKLLGKQSNVGKGLIGEIVVRKTLGINAKNHCDCEHGFGNKYDLLDKEGFGKIDVKTSKLSENNYWIFTFNCKKYADVYICLGFDKKRKNILHVWIIPNEKKYKDSTGINIKNDLKSLNNYKEFEVDSVSYNKTLKKLSKNFNETKGQNCVMKYEEQMGEQYEFERRSCI